MCSYGPVGGSRCPCCEKDLNKSEYERFKRVRVGSRGVWYVLVTHAGACRSIGGGDQVPGHAVQGRQGPGQVQQAHRHQVRQGSPSTHPTAPLAEFGPVCDKVRLLCRDKYKRNVEALRPLAALRAKERTLQQLIDKEEQQVPHKPAASLARLVWWRLMGRVVMAAVGAHGRGAAARGQPMRAAAETQDHPGTPTTSTQQPEAYPIHCLSALSRFLLAEESLWQRQSVVPSSACVQSPPPTYLSACCCVLAWL